MTQVITRIAILLALCGAAFAAGWFSKKSQVVVETKIQEVEKVIVKEVTVREQKPDGTVTETVTKESSTDSNVKRPDPITLKPTHREWALGVQFKTHLLYQDKPVYYPTVLSVERRAFGNLWGTLGVDIHHKELQVGVRVEF